MAGQSSRAVHRLRETIDFHTSLAPLQNSDLPTPACISDTSGPLPLLSFNPQGKLTIILPALPHTNLVFTWWLTTLHMPAKASKTFFLCWATQKVLFPKSQCVPVPLAYRYDTIHRSHITVVDWYPLLYVLWGPSVYYVHYYLPNAGKESPRNREIICRIKGYIFFHVSSTLNKEILDTKLMRFYYMIKSTFHSVVDNSPFKNPFAYFNVST